MRQSNAVFAFSRLAVALATLTIVLRAQPPAPTPADLILTNGKVLTIDSADSTARALAIANGKIVAVGSDDRVGAFRGPRTIAVDLNGRTVTPGLIDSHVHFSEAAALYTIDLGDGNVHTVGDVLQRVGDRVKAAKPGEWIQGRGWDEGKLAERRYLT